MTDVEALSDAVLAADLSAVGDALDVLGAEESAQTVWEAARRLEAS